MNTLINKGSIVRIKRGVFVSKGVDGSITKRSYTVTVHRVARGITATPRTIMTDAWHRDHYLKHGGDLNKLEELRDRNIFEYDNMEVNVTPSCVIWAGSGGYWRHTSIANVELVSHA